MNTSMCAVRQIADGNRKEAGSSTGKRNGKNHTRRHSQAGTHMLGRGSEFMKSDKNISLQNFVQDALD